MVEEDTESEVKSRSDIESPLIPPLESEEETIPTDDLLDDSKLIEYNLEALKLYDDAFEWLSSCGQKFCIISLIGKSRFGKKLNQVLFPLLRPKREFRKVAAFGDSGIDIYWCATEKVIFLIPNGTNDFSKLIEIARLIENTDNEFDAQKILKDFDVQMCVQSLFLMSICHFVLLVQPSTSLDVELTTQFLAISESRKLIMNQLSMLIGSIGAKPHWIKNARIVQPKLLILFEKCGLSQEDLRDFADGDYSRGKRKRVPQKKLIDCMERQIINIFKNGRLIPEKTPTNLFKISEKNAFIFVLQPEESKINEECLPIPACLDLLKESIKVQRDVETAASDRSWLPKRRRAEDMWQEYDSWKSKLDQGEEVWNFLSVHIDNICGKSSRSRSRSQEPVELNQLLPVADILFRYIVEGKLPENIEEEDSLKAHEMRETILAKLQKALNPEWTFSDQRCGKLVPEAYKTYLTNLPSHYTTRIHNNQVDQALMIYHGYARGPAVKTYEKQLKEQCKEEWHNGRQLCEVRSLTDRHCVHKWHRLPGEAGEGLIMPHNSRTKSLTASTCGEIQVQRDDPFTLEEANFMFYNDLESKLHVKEGKIIFDTYNAESAQLQEVLSHLKLEGPKSQLSASQKSDRENDGSDEAVDDITSVIANKDRFLTGIETTDTPKGLLPRFPSWSCLKIGDFSWYSELKGIEQQGFINRANFLLRWDISASCRGFIGYEYETIRGHRFFMQSPQKMVQGGSSGVAAPANVLLDHEYMPLYVPGPASRGNRSSATVGQLARIWFAIPANCDKVINVRPLVTPGRNAPTFRTTPEEFTLSPGSIWVLRFPFVYRDEQKTYFAPKENNEFSHFKVAKILSRSTANG